MNATWPLALLLISHERVSLRLRGLARKTGAVPLDAAPSDLARIFPTHIMWTKGVGFTDHHDREWYFWTRRGQRVLAVLQEHGYPVTYAVERARKARKMTP